MTGKKLQKKPTDNNNLLEETKNEVGNSKSVNMFLRYPFVLQPGNRGLESLLLPKSLVFGYPEHTASPKVNRQYRCRNGKIRKKRLRCDPSRVDACNFLIQGLACPNLVYKSFGCPERTARYKLSQLRNLKWIIKVGFFYMLNPLLDFLIWNCGWMPVLEYASYNIDLFTLLSYPLYFIKEPTEFSAKVWWQSISERGDVRCELPSDPKMRPVFHALLFVNAKLSDGLQIQTCLPINYHFNFLKNKRMQNTVFINHLCIPCDWSLFGINKPTYFSGYNEEADQKDIVHFDHSITIRHYGRHSQYVLLKKPYERAVKNWNGAQYVECTTPEAIERLFKLRFQRNLHGEALFSQMGLSKKDFSRKVRDTSQRSLYPAQ